MGELGFKEGNGKNDGDQSISLLCITSKKRWDEVVGTWTTTRLTIKEQERSICIICSLGNFPPQDFLIGSSHRIFSANAAAKTSHRTKTSGFELGRLGS